MGLSNIMNLNTTPIIGVEEFLAQKPDGIITVTGYEYKPTKDRKGNPVMSTVYHIKELGGIRLWSSGGTMTKLIPENLEEEYGDIVEANKSLKKRALRFKISAMKKMSDGGQWRPIDCLGYEDDGDGEV